MDEFSFFGSNGTPDPVPDDLDDDAIPPDEYGPPEDALTSASDTPVETNMPTGIEGDSVSDGIG